MQRLTLPYAPRWFQAKTHNELQRFNVLVFHRRAGKTVLAINQLIKQITNCPRDLPQGHYIAPYYKQVKRIAWKYLKSFTASIPGMKYNQSDLIATFPNGAEIELLGGDNFDALRGIYSDYAVLDEFAQMHPSLWGEVFRPALSDRKGGAIFIGTPKGHNQFYEKWEQAAELPGWYRAVYPVTETGALDLDEIQAAYREMEREEFEQEYLCSWSAAIKGAFYGKLMEQLEKRGRITDVPHDPSLPVTTSWDLGIRDFTTIKYWQLAGREHRLIKVDTLQGVGIDQMVAKVNENKGWTFKRHVFPHDVRVRELGTGKSRLDIFRSLGLECDIAPNLSIADGISQVRNLLPQCVMDRTHCRDAIEALKLYRTEYDERNRIFKANPVHDWTSHYADNVRMYAVHDHRDISDLFGNDYNDLDEGVI